ncbi:MAG: acyl-CoA thioesterase II [Gammaproteobacteria bacterium]|nr:acyl-CoA thioesterase II [Gammaproteobacteria bacterium]
MPQSRKQPVDALARLLDLDQIEHNLFRAYHPAGRTGRLYGGQIMAQALMAAARTVSEERSVHSLHGYFLRPGDPAIPALIDVERIRDGTSFSTRRVVVIQHGQAIFTMDASFHLHEPGLTHQLPMPEREPPRDEQVPGELRLRNFLGWRHDHKRLLSETPQPPAQDLWFKANGEVADDPLLHACLLVYESDNALLSTGRLPHRGNFQRERLQMASLDHAMWFHRPALDGWRADRWLLYALDSPSSSQARGYNRGLIFTADGLLVATTMQEGLMRQR